MNLRGTLFWKESMMNITSRFGSRIDLQFTQNRNESIVYSILDKIGSESYVKGSTHVQFVIYTKPYEFIV